MGMFDYVKCEYPLPDGFDASGVEFQTKDMDCDLNTLTITPEGRLMLNGEDDTEYHGDMRFYSSNVVVVASEYFCTQDDKPYWRREYIARFTEGTVSRITVSDSADGDTSGRHRTKKESPDAR